MITSFFSNKSNTQRSVLIGGVIAIALFSLFAWQWLYQPAFAPLFKDLQPGDAAKIVSELERAKGTYRLEDEGATILVPEADVHPMRLKLMSSGVPLSGSVGFELFDNADFGMTEFAQRINYQRALQGELTRTIVSLKEVKFARVHLVLPEAGLFRDEGNAPSASVTLFLEENERPPSDLQIAGIQRLVAASVPKLSPSQVTITNADGLTLSRGESSDTGDESVTEQLQKKMDMEKYLAAKASDVLLKAFGPNQAMVSIDVTLDFSKTTSTTEEIIPAAAGGQLGSLLRKRESRVRGGEDVAPDSNKDNVTTEVEYQFGKQVAQVSEVPGRIQRMSVGVVVPADTPSERRTAIRDLVAASIGFDESRGDAIEVYAMTVPVNPAVNSRVEELEKAVVSLTATLAVREDNTAAMPESKSNTAQEQVTMLVEAVQDIVSNEKNNALLWTVMGVVAVAGLVLGFFARRRRRVTADSLRRGDESNLLSPEERQKLLAQVQNWLQDESGASGRREIAA